MSIELNLWVTRLQGEVRRCHTETATVISQAIAMNDQWAVRHSAQEDRVANLQRLLERAHGRLRFLATAKVMEVRRGLANDGPSAYCPKCAGTGLPEIRSEPTPEPKGLTTEKARDILATVLAISMDPSGFPLDDPTDAWKALQAEAKADQGELP